MRIHRTRRHGERGGVQSTGFVLIAPALVLVIFGGMQVAVWYHAKDVVLSAAQTAADIERVAGRSGGGAEAATSVANHGGVDDVSVSMDRGAQMVTVTVRGRAHMFIDLPLSTITQSVTVPRERVTTP